MKLLLVEDNVRLASVMAKLLAENGMIVDAVNTIDAAQAALRLADYDIIVLDLSLPDGDGSVLLRTLRRAGTATPILVATARSGVADRVGLLNAGADDYLVKPFSLDELLARIRALLRRPAQTTSAILTMGNLSLDLVAQSVAVDGRPVELPRLELRVLAALLRHPGQLMSRTRLESAAYPADAEVTANAIEAVISRLRKNLEVTGSTVAITTMRGLGYVLTQRPAGG